MPNTGCKRIAFFGGSFTGMCMEEQNQFLEVAKAYIEKGAVAELQLSTRPDYISQAILDNLKSYGVRIIELGAQSLDAEVLSQAGRGHTIEDVKIASELICENGFELGLQMMIGLPGDSYSKSMQTAQKIIDFGASYTRIYPALVIKDTQLETLYRRNEYSPLSLDEAVRWSKDLMKLFEKHTVRILRIGLHPSEGLINGDSLVAGPFHRSFKELVCTARWKELFSEILKQKGESIVIKINPNQINAAVGYNKENKNLILKFFKKVAFETDNKIEYWKFDYRIQ